MTSNVYVWCWCGVDAVDRAEKAAIVPCRLVRTLYVVCTRSAISDRTAGTKQKSTGICLPGASLFWNIAEFDDVSGNGLIYTVSISQVEAPGRCDGLLKKASF